MSETTHEHINVPVSTTVVTFNVDEENSETEEAYFCAQCGARIATEQVVFFIEEIAS